MKLSIAILFLFISVALSYRTVQYEWGTGASCAFNTGHILEKLAAVPRSLETIVKFKKAFKTKPDILISPQLLDFEAGLPQGFIAQVTEVSLEDFKLRLTAVSHLKYYSFYFVWYAFSDPNVAVYTLETTQVAPLNAGEGDRKITLNIPINLADAATAVAYVNGVKHVVTNAIVRVWVASVTPKQVAVNVQTYWLAKLEMVRVAVLVGTEKSLWVGPPLTIQTLPGWESMKARAPGVATVVHKQELPKIWQSGQRVAVFGFGGWDVEKAANFRLKFDVPKLESTMETVIQSWWDSKVYNAFYQAAVYAPDTNLRIFDEKCSELFSECDFQGDSITICDRIPDLPAAGWSKPIKSLTVPAQRRLYLFNKEKYDGKKTFYTENQKCLDNLEFTFVQLGHLEELSSQQ